jgi:hypothetical protein
MVIVPGMSFDISASPKSDRNSRPVTLLTRELRQLGGRPMRQANQPFTRAFSAVLLATAWTVSAATAAGAQTEQSPPSPSEQKPDISDQKLDATAAALERVVVLKNDYERQLQKAPTSDMQRIADEAKDAFAKAVTDQGLSIEEYNSILVVAQNDPEVRKKILQRIRPVAK